MVKNDCCTETNTIALDSATNNPMSNAGVQPTLTQTTALSIYRILAQILDDPPHLTKLVTALPLHRVMIVILSSNPYPETVATTFAIYSSAIAHSPDDQFEKKFSAEVSSIATVEAFDNLLIHVLSDIGWIRPVCPPSSDALVG